MKNADMPAMPVLTYEDYQCSEGLPAGYSATKKRIVNHGGLTKREELAARNMAAILSSVPHWEAMGYRVLDDSDYAKQAVDAADALLAELDKLEIAE